MKKRINLLSPEALASSGDYIKFPLLEGPLLVKATAFILVLLAALTIYERGLFYVYRAKLADAKKKYANSQTELKQNKDIVARLTIEKNNMIQQRKNLEDKINLLSHIERPGSEKSTLLSHLTKLIPDNMWITKIVLEKNTLKLVGKTTENASVSDLMIELDKSGDFKNTTFNYTQKKKVNDKDVIEFEISTVLTQVIGQ